MGLLGSEVLKVFWIRGLENSQPHTSSKSVARLVRISPMRGELSAQG